ncbi:MAG: RteC domain-containing protein [Dysgonamonadaceae bacterium]|jgi:hypothetical protein|nr:RteC domain-containing protein [Dysgonamonadaceae bacterium]MDR1527056.1 RteC domain-containing protein [Dysgonamonadaceae bacterium]
MEQFVHNLKERINTDIQNIELSENDICLKSSKIIQVLEVAFEELKIFIAGYTFKDQTEEILFFKEIKPGLFSQLVYHNKLYTIEMRTPTGSGNDKRIYWENMLGRIKYFFDMNFEFYHYYRSGSTHLDKFYFLRGKHDIQLILDSFYFERDTRFSTSHDFKVSKILANEMLTVYLNNKLLRLEQHSQYIAEDSSAFLKAKHTWTGSKTDLVEMIYGIHVRRCLNNGQIELKELADYFGNFLNIDLKDIYRIYLNIRSRKDSRTLFLDSMTDALNHKMDEDDRR